MGGQSSSSSTANNVSKAMIDKEIQSCIRPSISRLTNGLPQHELKLIMLEAQECEEALLKEIRLLEASAGLPLTPANNTGKSTSDTGSNGPSDGVATNSANNTKKTTESKSEKSDYDPNNSLAMGGWAYDAMEGLNHHTNVDSMRTSEITPTDRYFSLSAVLGRLRQPLNVSPIPQASEFTTPAPSSKSSKNKSSSNSSVSSENRRKSTSKKSGSSGDPNSSSSNNNNNSSTLSNTALEKQQQNERKQNWKFLEKQKALLALEKNPIYHKTLEQPQLLALWKRISSHRTATVFRRPVSTRDAPGYEDRILFPIDMSLIRKMIVSGIITCYSDLHQRIGLICHNCVKFNGRESDYGAITRDFEAYVDDVIVGVVSAASAAAAQASATSSSSLSASQQAAATGSTNESSK